MEHAEKIHAQVGRRIGNNQSPFGMFAPPTEEKPDLTLEGPPNITVTEGYVPGITIWREIIGAFVLAATFLAAFYLFT